LNYFAKALMKSKSPAVLLWFHSLATNPNGDLAGRQSADLKNFRPISLIRKSLMNFCTSNAECHLVI